MLLYHGSKYSDIDEFVIQDHELRNLDFRKGVYFTSHFEQAQQWACKDGTSGVVYECDVDLSKLTALPLVNSDDEGIYYILYLCRIGLEEIAPDAVDGFDDADVIYGYMLDGCTKKFEKYAELFNAGELSFADFRGKTKLFRADKDQYCFKTESAIKILNAGFQKIYLVEKQGENYIVTETFDW